VLYYKEKDYFICKVIFFKCKIINYIVLDIFWLFNKGADSGVGVQSLLYN